MKITIDEEVRIFYYNCRDCNAPLPVDRREIGYCQACWKPFAIPIISTTYFLPKNLMNRELTRGEFLMEMENLRRDFEALNAGNIPELGG